MSIFSGSFCCQSFPVRMFHLQGLSKPRNPLFVRLLSISLCGQCSCWHSVRQPKKPLLTFGSVQNLYKTFISEENHTCQGSEPLKDIVFFQNWISQRKLVALHRRLAQLGVQDQTPLNHRLSGAHCRCTWRVPQTVELRPQRMSIQAHKNLTTLAWYTGLGCNLDQWHDLPMNGFVHVEEAHLGTLKPMKRIWMSNVEFLNFVRLPAFIC